MELRRVRNFLGLRQIDVSFATGIPVWRLSKAENGNLRLNRSEEQVLREFLAARMRIVAEASAGESEGKDGR
jgi:hypothetical protein